MVSNRLLRGVWAADSEVHIKVSSRDNVNVKRILVVRRAQKVLKEPRVKGLRKICGLLMRILNRILPYIIKRESQLQTGSDLGRRTHKNLPATGEIMGALSCEAAL